MSRRYSTLVMILAPFVVLNLITIFFWSNFPPQIPLSWDEQGKPAIWGSRNHLWLMPGYYLLSAVALRVFTLCFPDSCNASNTRALNFLLGGMAMFFLMHHSKNMLFAWTLTTKTNQGFEFMAVTNFMVLLGISFMASTPNPVLGIPTPWARASADHWKKVHRFAGRSCLFYGMFLQSMLLFGRPIVPAIGLFAIVVTSVLYSYQLHKGSRESVAS